MVKAVKALVVASGVVGAEIAVNAASRESAPRPAPRVNLGRNGPTLPPSAPKRA
jgi:hypothetical protein